MSTSMNNMEQISLMEASRDQQTCGAVATHSEMSMWRPLQTLETI